MEIDRFYLLNHNETRQVAVFWDRYVKGECTICVCYWAYNSQTGTSIEQLFADNISRVPTFLFMSGLRIKRDRDDVPLFRDISRHLPGLLANWLTPINLTGLVAFGNMGNEIFKAVAAAYPFGWCHDHNAFFDSNIYFITDIELRI